MKSSGNISALIKLNKSVVVSLDCQLYTKCIELKWNKNIRSKVVGGWAVLDLLQFYE